MLQEKFQGLVSFIVKFALFFFHTIFKIYGRIFPLNIKYHVLTRQEYR